MKKTSDAQKRAVRKYNDTNTKSYLLRYNIKTDAEIIAQLEKVPSKMGYIRKLIRDDMQK